MAIAFMHTAPRVLLRSIYNFIGLLFDVIVKNRDRFIQLGIAIAALRKMRGMSQEKLAELSNVSRSHISAIEAPGIVRPFSLEVFYNIADALDIYPADLINASVFPDKILTNSKKNK